ncbi:hypothetical protein BJF78_10300 [Pseudonocardia sp. CNS-139]|nr:hypothetical protein BJF78_10300 [Pseudonocardia sp. CNS-139]
MDEEHLAARQRPLRQPEQRAGHTVVVRGCGEAVLGAVLGAGRRERGVGVEAGAGDAGGRDEGAAHAGREHGTGRDEARGDELDGPGVLPDGDQLACAGEQVVVHAAGQCQQQVVGRVPRRRPVPHPPPSRPAGPTGPVRLTRRQAPPQNATAALIR